MSPAPISIKSTSALVAPSIIYDETDILATT